MFDSNQSANILVDLILDADFDLYFLFSRLIQITYIFRHTSLGHPCTFMTRLVLVSHTSVEVSRGYFSYKSFIDYIFLVINTYSTLSGVFSVVEASQVDFVSSDLDL